MKKTICLILTCLIAGHAFGQARLGTYPWTVNLKVVDDNNRPVEGVQAWVGYGSVKEGQSTDPFQSSGWAIAGLTDTNGLFTATHTDRSWTLGINAKKSGYYQTHISYQLYVPGQFDDQKVAANRNPKLTIVLKELANPSLCMQNQ